MRFLLLALGASASIVAADAEVSWSYEGETGPENWGNLPNSSLCKNGTTQSPIAIMTDSAEMLDGQMDMNYKTSTASVMDNGHTIVVTFEEPLDNRVSWKGEDYSLVQMHFHSPAEHSIDGKFADMVVHLVHQNKDGQLLVIGVPMQGGSTESMELQAIMEAVSKSGQNDEASNGMIQIDPTQMLPTTAYGFFHYQGSLTTPTCSEEVLWFVTDQPLEIDSKQVDAFQSHYKNNVRPIQSLEGRSVFYLKNDN